MKIQIFLNNDIILVNIAPQYLSTTSIIYNKSICYVKFDVWRVKSIHFKIKFFDFHRFVNWYKRNQLISAIWKCSIDRFWYRVGGGNNLDEYCH